MEVFTNITCLHLSSGITSKRTRSACIRLLLSPLAQLLAYLGSVITHLSSMIVTLTCALRQFDHSCLNWHHLYNNHFFHCYTDLTALPSWTQDIHPTTLVLPKESATLCRQGFFRPMRKVHHHMPTISLDRQIRLFTSTGCHHHESTARRNHQTYATHTKVKNVRSRA